MKSQRENLDTTRDKKKIIGISEEIFKQDIEEIKNEIDKVEKEEEKIEREIKKVESDIFAFDIWIIFVILFVGILIIGIFGYYYNKNSMMEIPDNRAKPYILPEENASVDKPIIELLSVPLKDTEKEYCGDKIYYFYYPGCSFCNLSQSVIERIKKRFNGKLEIEEICGWDKGLCRREDRSYNYELSKKLIKEYDIRKYPSWVIGCKLKRESPFFHYIERNILDEEEIKLIEETEISIALCYLNNFTLEECRYDVIYYRNLDCDYCSVIDSIYNEITTPLAKKVKYIDKESRGENKLIIPRTVITYDIRLRKFIEKLFLHTTGEITFSLNRENYTFFIPQKMYAVYVFTESCPICETGYIAQWLNDFKAMGGSVYLVDPKNTTIPIAPAIYLRAEVFRAYQAIIRRLMDKYSSNLHLELLDPAEPNSDFVIIPPTVETGFEECSLPNKTIIFYFYRPGDKLSMASLEAFNITQRELSDYIASSINCISFNSAEKELCKKERGIEGYIYGKLLQSKYRISSAPAIVYNCRYLRKGSFALSYSVETESKLIKKEICTLLKIKPDICLST